MLYPLRGAIKQPPSRPFLWQRQGHCGYQYVGSCLAELRELPGLFVAVSPTSLSVSQHGRHPALTRTRPYDFSPQFFPQFKLLLIAAVAYGIDDSVLKFKDAAGECTITKYGASLSLGGGCSLDATLTLEPDVSGAIGALEQKIHEELHDVICDQHVNHANVDMVYSGVFSHATYNFCKFNCATDHFWDGSACSACAAPSTCPPGEVMNTPVCDGSTTANRICTPCTPALASGFKYTTANSCASAEAFVYSTAQHTSILLSDGCSANTVDDQIEYVKLDSDSGGALTATVGYKPLHSGSWTMSNGVSIQCWHYAAGSWDTSPILDQQDGGIGNGYGNGNGPSRTHTFTFTPRAGAGDHFVRCGIIDRSSSSCHFDAGTHCATSNSGSYGSSHHFDNADVSFTM
jgi:hypothetical protein